MTKRSKLRVRTGCITCRGRKIKCDETKPFCRRCTAFGRKCEGYGRRESTYESTVPVLASPPPPNSSRPTSDLLGQQSSPNIDKPLSSAMAGDEVHWLCHFNAHTGPALAGSSGVLDTHAFWTQEVPQLSVSERPVRHALLSLSACYARFEARLNGKMRYPGIIKEEFSIRHYNLAIASLRRAIEAGQAKLQVVLICCVLFISLECLHGNTIATLEHLENGLKVLASYRKTQGHSHAVAAVAKNVEPILLRFKGQATFFGTKDNVAIEDEAMSFVDLASAKARLDMLIQACMSFVRRARTSSGAAQDCDEPSMQTTQKILLEQLLSWELRMRSLATQDPPRLRSNDPSTIMLHVREQATFVYVSLCLTPFQMLSDAYFPRFKKIVQLVGEFVVRRRGGNDTGSGSPSTTASTSSGIFTLESAMIPALFLTAVKCRDPLTRRRAVHLLETQFVVEGLWNAQLAAKAAQRVIDIETKTSSKNGLQWPSQRERVYEVDIKRISEEPERRGRLTVQLAPDGPQGKKVVLSEEITF